MQEILFQKAAQCLVGIALLVLAPVAMAVPADSPADNPALLYHNYCSVCHGDKGNGVSRASRTLNPPPRDFTSERARNELHRERIVHAIREGRPGTAMVAWKDQLNENEITALADYLLMTFVQPRAQAPGRDLYTKNCSVCHGDDGKGGEWTTGMKLRPRDFTSQRAAMLSREAMIEAVTHGRPGTPMAAFGSQLGATEIEQVVDFIRAEFIAKAPDIAGLSGTSAHGRPAQVAAVSKPKQVVETVTVAPTILGDASRGEGLYMANCTQCHGPNGDGQGPRAYFIFPKPANFYAESYRQRLTLPVLTNSIAKGVQGREMPAWEKVMNPQQIADIAAFVYQRFLTDTATDTNVGSAANPQHKKKP